MKNIYVITMIYLSAHMLLFMMQKITCMIGVRDQMKVFEANGEQGMNIAIL